MIPKQFLVGSKMKLCAIHVRMGIPEAIGLDVPNLIKDVSNLMKDVPNFVKNVRRVPNCIPRWGSTPNHFLMGFQMKLWTIDVQMGVPKAIGSDVPNFVNDVAKVPNCVPMWGSTPNHFVMGF